MWNVNAKVLAPLQNVHVLKQRGNATVDVTRATQHAAITMIRSDCITSMFHFCKLAKWNCGLQTIYSFCKIWYLSLQTCYDEFANSSQQVCKLNVQFCKLKYEDFLVKMVSLQT